MGVGRTVAAALQGVQAHLVEVEADVASGLPAFGLVGLPDASLSEAKDRVRAAVANSGWPLPARRITVNLSPAALPKTGPAFDMAIAVAVLAAMDVVAPASAESAIHLGELGLDGQVRPVRGVLPAVAAAVAGGWSTVVVPWSNAEEAALVPGARVVGAQTLADVVACHRGDPIATPPSASRRTENGGAGDPDLADVAGQSEARYALEVAAAGGHHLLMQGPPGAGKTMLAARLPGLLPDLDDRAALEVTTVHSVAGTLGASTGLLRRPPFEDPHHTSSAASLVGGGSRLPRPGAASRAHHGVLFLDEAPEFDPRALEALRQPLEHGELVLHRTGGSARYPARFQLVMAANPCPCGMLAPNSHACMCSPIQRRRYLTRLSGPLLDRVDMHVVVQPVTRAAMAAAALGSPPETSAVVRRRVEQARATQTDRLRAQGWRSNADVPGAWLRGALRLPVRTTTSIDRALDHGGLTMRGYDRCLRVAWTLADLRTGASPGPDEVVAAYELRASGPVAA